MDEWMGGGDGERRSKAIISAPSGDGARLIPSRLGTQS
jgi:hypothetical protein